LKALLEKGKWEKERRTIIYGKLGEKRNFSGPTVSSRPNNPEWGLRRKKVDPTLNFGSNFKHIKPLITRFEGISEKQLRGKFQHRARFVVRIKVNRARVKPVSHGAGWGEG